MNKNILALMPVFVFMIIMLIVSIYVRRASAKKASEGFVKDYFIGSRSLGGFVLAMTTVATYSSVSSFVGGPGQAWSIGFGWIYMSVVQVTALLLVLGILGKKMAMVSRKIDAVTIIDVIRHRYQSDVLANISAIIIVIFFAATMVAQFVGGAKLFEAVTGYSYLTGLIVFGLVVVIYTTVGGFRGVAITDAICAVVMLAGMVILLIGIIRWKYAGESVHFPVDAGWYLYIGITAVSSALFKLQRYKIVASCDYSWYRCCRCYEYRHELYWCIIRRCSDRKSVRLWKQCG